MRSDDTSSNLNQTDSDTLTYTELSSVAQDYHTLPHNTLQDGSYQTSTLLLNNFMKDSLCNCWKEGTSLESRQLPRQLMIFLYFSRISDGEVHL
jgi:hypothetical protein